MFCFLLTFSSSKQYENFIRLRMMLSLLYLDARYLDACLMYIFICYVVDVCECMFCLCVSVCVFVCFNVLRQKGRRWRRSVCVCVYQRKSLFPRPLIIPHPPASLITPRPPAPFLFYIGRLEGVQFRRVM